MNFTFKGRAGRLEFFTARVVLLLAWGVAAGVAAMFGGERYTVPVLIMGLVVVELLCWPFTVRRFHDLGYPGVVLICLFIPAVGFICGLLLLLKKGELYANRFGEPEPSRNIFRDIFRRSWLFTRSSLQERA